MQSNIYNKENNKDIHLYVASLKKYLHLMEMWFSLTNKMYSFTNGSISMWLNVLASFAGIWSVCWFLPQWLSRFSRAQHRKVSTAQTRTPVQTKNLENFSHSSHVKYCTWNWVLTRGSEESLLVDLSITSTGGWSWTCWPGRWSMNPSMGTSSCLSWDTLQVSPFVYEKS